MLPKMIFNLDDADDGLCNGKYLEPTSAKNTSSRSSLDETYSGGQYDMVVPSRNIHRDASTMKSQSNSNESQRQGKPFSNQ